MTVANTMWDRVGSTEVVGLGARLAGQLEQLSGAGWGPAGDLDKVLRRLSGQVEEALAAVGGMVRDPALREDLARAGQRLGGTAGAAVTEAGQGLVELLRARAGRLAAR